MHTAYQPQLKLYFTTLDTSKAIRDAYEHIQGFSLCWLAFECLEDIYHAGILNDYIRFIKQSGQIQFICRLTGRMLAIVHFDNRLVSMGGQPTISCRAYPGIS